MAPAPSDGSSPNPILTFLPFLLMILVVWFLLIRPQRKRAKEHTTMLSSLQKGDKVVTNSGMLGTIVGFNEGESTVVLKVGDDTKIEFLKSSIAGKMDK
jgi:preprotein translocase subunit YajC